MACFQFGPRRKILDRDGKEYEAGDCALHVQCAWRIAQEVRVIVGRQDLYYPAQYDEEKPYPADFDWEHDPNRHDERLKVLFENDTREFLVTGIEVGAAGSFQVALGDSFSLEIFPSNSLSGEPWRLFEPRMDKPHFVVTGKGIDG